MKLSTEDWDLRKEADAGSLQWYCMLRALSDFEISSTLSDLSISITGQYTIMSDSAANKFDVDAKFDWENYMAQRPDYTASNFYDLVWAYHERHSDRYALAHDVGTGPGNVAEVLAKRFQRVIASDPSQLHINTAARRINNPSVIYKQCRAEDLVNAIDPNDLGQADLVTAAECIPLMHAEQAMSVFEQLLRPGGTVAIWFYGRPIFAGKGQEKSQAIYDRLIGKAFERVLPIKGSPMAKSFVTMASWLDVVPFSHENWSGVERIKWNNDRPMSFLDEQYSDFEVKYESAVDPADKIEERKDRDFWAKEDCGIEWVKGFINAQWPWKTTDDDIGAQMEPMYEELETAMGGKGSKTKIAWPVVLLLATRK